MKELLLADGVITPISSKSHITYTIHLYQDCRDLHVEFAYEPKKLEDRGTSRELITEALVQFNGEDGRDRYEQEWESYLPLQNLLTLSFDDEERFRGAGHRHDPVQHLVIREDEASPGLLPGPIPRGQLRIMINVHCVVTEECRYRLRVWEGGTDERQRFAAMDPLRTPHAYVPQ